MSDRWPTNDVTASFLPDGTPCDNGAPSNLFASLDVHLPRAKWQGAFVRALAAWDSACALSLTWADDGDIRFGGRDLGNEIMGWTYLPGEGELAGDSFLATNFTYFPGGVPFLFGIMMHEIGHALGLEHSDDPDAVMYPAANVFAGLAPDDIRRIQALYGPPPPLVLPDGYEGNNTSGTAVNLGTITAPFGLVDLTLNRPKDNDWFTFVAGETGSFIVTATFEQVGGTGATFCVAFFGPKLTRLANGTATSGSVQVHILLREGRRYYLRCLSLYEGGLFKYGLSVARA